MNQTTTRGRHFDTAVRKFINAVRNNPAFLKDADEFIKVIETEISWLESELNKQSQLLSQSIKDERYLLDIMQMYGIDLNVIGLAHPETIKEQIKTAKYHDHLIVPDRLKKHVKQLLIKKTDNYKWL